MVRPMGRAMERKAGLVPALTQTQTPTQIVGHTVGRVPCCNHGIEQRAVRRVNHGAHCG